MLYTDRAASEEPRAARATARGEVTAKARVTTRSVEECEVAFVAVAEPP